MAIAFVGAWTPFQVNGGSSGTSNTRVVTAGNLIVSCHTASNTVGAAMSSNCGTFVNAQPVTNGTFDANGGDNTRQIYIENCTGNAAGTVSIAQGSGNGSAAAAGEWSGVLTAASIDKTVTGKGNSTALSSGAAATTTQADELLIGTGQINAGTNSSFTAGASFTMEGSMGLLSGGVGAYIEDRIVAATGAYSAPATWTGSAATWTAMLATYKAAAGGGAAAVYDPAQIVGQRAAIQRASQW